VIAFTVPGAPQGKGRPRAVKIGGFTRLAADKKTVAYEGLVAHAAQVAMAGRPLIDQAVACNVFIDCEVPASWSGKKQRAALAGTVMPTTKPDADNVVKAIFDGLNGVLWRDDVLVVDLRVRKRYAATPCVRVEVWGVSEPLAEQGAAVEQPAQAPLIEPEPEPETPLDAIEREVERAFG
jgi:Holliday junction resolvase RusA-like endonuclease